MKDFIQAYEKKATKQITKELFMFLCENIDKADEIKKIYKEVLNQNRKFDNNYYSKICIIINTLKYNKNHNLEISYPYDLYYIKLQLRGELKIELEDDTKTIKTIEKPIEYSKIPSIIEGRGEEKTKNKRQNLIISAKKIFKEETIDLKRAIKWKEQYKDYIITTYGRWSKEYEDYMTTLFDVGFLPVGPNLLISINRYNVRYAIKDKLKILENKL